MQAAILTEPNTPFRVESVALDPPKAGEVLVKIAASTNLPGAVITRAEKIVRGCSYGSVNPQRDIPLLLDLYRAGKLKLEALITRRYRLEQINEAYADLLSGELARGIIVF